MKLEGKNLKCDDDEAERCIKIFVMKLLSALPTFSCNSCLTMEIPSQRKRLQKRTVTHQQLIFELKKIKTKKQPYALTCAKLQFV